MMENVSNASVVGSLMYVMLCTHCSTINLVSRYQSNLGRPHWQVVNRIFHYLCGTVNLTFYYQGGYLQLIGYYDEDLRGDKD